MEEGLIQFLLADAGVAALVNGRITWFTRPQASSVPAIVLSRVSADRDYHMGGPSGLVESRVQVDCWAASAASAVSVGRAVLSALSGKRQQLGAVWLFGAFAEAERQSFEEGSGGEEFHRVSMDFILHHTEN